MILLGLLVGSSLVSSALRAQPLPVPSSVGAPSVRLGNVEAAYIPYVPAAGDVAPPAGRAHHYHFIVYALDTTIATKPGPMPLTRGELLDAIKGHVIGQGELVATYERK